MNFHFFSFCYSITVTVTFTRNHYKPLYIKVSGHFSYLVTRYFDGSLSIYIFIYLL
ncbi:hypothetical protein P7951_41 [Streptococcus phage P7951]|uniref:Uncharacterized protein n=2 Tax=Brussowvirus TaxID=1623303 RepID=A0A286QS19_9CAUD|nr:hypothetical protein PQF01_gp41 [Streptococcus phage P7951]YP_010683257.1 hypothetical protein PQF05_gp44 [Streptococcus phage P7955]ARU14226.1 hypothetical protein P7951_41 [Streptococcus phage P7951]ARU14413.1 hypothetical protein P7955_44 [Streptococcus phage P7955]